MKEIAGIALEKLDGPTRDVFSPEKDMMALVLEERALIRHQLANSGRFLEVLYFTVTPATQEFSLEGFAQGFVEAERVERLINDIVPVQYETVPIVDIADVDSEAWNGQYAITFFGTPMQARISWDPTYEVWNSLKIWYNNQGVEPATQDTEDGSPLLILKYLIATRAALQALPKLNKRAPDQYPAAVVQMMASAFTATIAQLTEEFSMYRFDSGQAGQFQIERYDVGRRRPRLFGFR
jgi:hypothetical protein